MLVFGTIALLLSAGLSDPAGHQEVRVCSRTMRFEDQYCAARTEGRRWGHQEAAQAHELYARYALPERAGAAWLLAANNWIVTGEPARAVIAFDRAMAAGLPKDQRAAVRAARGRAAQAELTGGR